MFAVDHWMRMDKVDGYGKHANQRPRINGQPRIKDIITDTPCTNLYFLFINYERDGSGETTGVWVLRRTILAFVVFS